MQFFQWSVLLLVLLTRVKFNEFSPYAKLFNQIFTVEY
jgi:hypothetical protein